MARSERFELPTLGIDRRGAERYFDLPPKALAALVDSVWDFFLGLSARPKTPTTPNKRLEIATPCRVIPLFDPFRTLVGTYSLVLRRVSLARGDTD